MVVKKKKIIKEKERGGLPKPVIVEMRKSSKEEPSEADIKKLKESQKKQLIWVFVVIGVIFLGFLFAYFYAQGLKTFDYAGIRFNKVKEFNIDFYHGRFPIVSGGKLLANYNFYLRNDPRENKISFDVQEANLRKSAILSLSPEAMACPNADIAHIELSKFLGAVGSEILGKDFVISGGSTDNATAKEMNITYATCKQASMNQTVVITQKSESPSIVSEGNNSNCYIINVGNCENIKASERFIVGLIAKVNSIDL